MRRRKTLGEEMPDDWLDIEAQILKIGSEWKTAFMTFRGPRATKGRAKKRRELRIKTIDGDCWVTDFPDEITEAIRTLAKLRFYWPEGHSYDCKSVCLSLVKSPIQESIHSPQEDSANGQTVTDSNGAQDADQGEVA